MAVALAAVKLGALVAVGLLVGWAGVRPAEAATTITLTADGYLVGLCQNVELTVYAISDQNSHSETLTLQHFEDGETLETLTDWNFVNTEIDAGVTRTHTVNHCERTARFYRANLRIRVGTTPPYAYGDVISVEWVHPSDLGLVKTTDAVFTSVSARHHRRGLQSRHRGGGGRHRRHGGAAPLGSDTARNRLRGAGVAGGGSDRGDRGCHRGRLRRHRRRPGDHPGRHLHGPGAAGGLHLRGPGHPGPGPTNWRRSSWPPRRGQVLVSPGQYLRTAYSEPVTVVLKPGSSDAPINTTDPGEPAIVAPGTAQEGINELARFIAEQTGMGTGASTTLLPLLCLLLAGAAAAVVVLPLGFSPLSLGAGFLVFTLVWSVGGVAWFALPIAMAALPPVLLAACGVMIFRQRGMFG